MTKISDDGFYIFKSVTNELPALRVSAAAKNKLAAILTGKIDGDLVDKDVENYFVCLYRQMLIDRQRDRKWSIVPICPILINRMYPFVFVFDLPFLKVYVSEDEFRRALIEEPLECPFCGHVPRVETALDGRFWIECYTEDCKGITIRTTMRTDRLVAIRDWNQRTVPKDK